jgi:hypothetical protein
MFSIVKYFRRNHFIEKNDFPENIFLRLARTKKYQRRKTESSNYRRNPATSDRRRQISVIVFRPNGRNQTKQPKSGCTGRNPIVLVKFQPVWPKSYLLESRKKKRMDSGRTGSNFG